MEDWTEKYRPKNLEEIVGNHQAIIELKKWANVRTFSDIYEAIDIQKKSVRN